MNGMRVLATGCLSAVLLGLVSPVLAQANDEWILIATDDESRVYLDAASIRRTSNGTQFRQRTEFTGSDDGRTRSIVLREARCANRETRVVEASVSYDDGRTITSGAGPWQYVTRGTADEDSIRFACNLGT